MPNGGESDCNRRVHVSTRDMANRVDHHRHDETTGNRRSQLRDSPFIARINSGCTTRHKYQQERPYDFSKYLS